MLIASIMPPVAVRRSRPLASLRDGQLDRRASVPLRPALRCGLAVRASLGVERDPPCRRRGLLDGPRCVERHARRTRATTTRGRAAVRRVRRLHTSGVLLCGALPQGRHASRTARHGLAVRHAPLLRSLRRGRARARGRRRAREPRRAGRAAPRRSARREEPALGRRARAAVAAARAARACSPRCAQRAGGQPLYSLPLVADVHVMFLLARAACAGATSTSAELARWETDARAAAAPRAGNLAREQRRARGCCGSSRRGRRWSSRAPATAWTRRGCCCPACTTCSRPSSARRSRSRSRTATRCFACSLDIAGAACGSCANAPPLEERAVAAHRDHRRPDGRASPAAADARPLERPAFARRAAGAQCRRSMSPAETDTADRARRAARARAPP